MKRVTMKMSDTQHRKLKDSAKEFGITQEELLPLIVDLTLTSTETIRPHAERFKRRKLAEQTKHKEMARRAENLIASLSPEMQDKLLAGDLDLSKLL